MLRGYRSIVLALVGWLILAGASAPSRNRSESEQQATQQEIANALGRAADAFDEANEPKRAEADCKKGADDRKSDLCAQWKAADAAADSATYASQSNTIGWISVSFGFITMGAAIAAAIYAAFAAHHTRRSADIAERSLVLTQRPQIVMSGFSIFLSNDKDIGEWNIFGLSFVWKNTGQTVAINFASYVKFDIIEDPKDIDQIVFPISNHYSGNNKSIGTLGRDRELSSDGIKIPKVDLERAAKGECGIVVFGEILYRDTFQTSDSPSHRTRVCALLQLPKGIDGITIDAPSDGLVRLRMLDRFNEAT